MTADAIREVMHQNIPFVLRSSDGKEFVVPHPDFISLGNQEDTAVIVHHDKGFSILDLENITAIDINIAEDASAT